MQNITVSTVRKWQSQSKSKKWLLWLCQYFYSL